MPGGVPPTVTATVSRFTPRRQQPRRGLVLGDAGHDIGGGHPVGGNGRVRGTPGTGGTGTARAEDEGGRGDHSEGREVPRTGTEERTHEWSDSCEQRNVKGRGHEGRGEHV
ncbi:hypothetical protein GCM10020256_62030 [Streptomyces thermocoprophilus]